MERKAKRKKHRAKSRKHKEKLWKETNDLREIQKANEPSSQKKKIFLLVATKHEYQCPSLKGSEKFRQLVIATCKDQDIKAIGEEMSRDALDLLSTKETKESVCKQVAEKLDIQHRYCDPSIEKQISLGIKNPRKVTDAEYSIDPDIYKRDPYVKFTFRIREGEWLKCLLELDTWPVLFVCGPNHTKSFPELLRDNRIDVPDADLSHWRVTRRKTK